MTQALPLHFISDLHLSPDTPELTTLFEQTLAQWQGHIHTLYILGDLFDAWIGDDDDSPYAQHIAEILQQFSQHTPIYFQHGNRDFLLGERYAKQSGMTLLPEKYLISHQGHRYLLTHGDALCTDDIPYMQFRTQSRHPAWQAAILAKPLDERRMLATQIRQMSEQGKAENGQTAITDASPDTILKLMQPYPNTTLIHGHTHRPASHTHQLANGESFQRHVIADWHHAQGGYLKADQDGISAHSLPEKA